ncbi:MAG: DUF3089 domain-containing protein [Bacteroidia bacterium]|nr:DUF3089 domain-containing protein [Bacteroidia bacterium]
MNEFSRIPRFAFSPTLLFACSSLWLFASCSDIKPPAAAFAPDAVSAAPDYSQSDNWSCLPNKQDFADLSPESVLPQDQEDAPADVFFVHPTTFMESDQWNANLADTALNLATDARAIKHQASIFNRAGRVFAPRYRQMVYGGFKTEDLESKKKALELAYEDVKAAFEYYLEHWNNGRPIIIAGHSQGAFHARNLLKEYFDGKPLQEQLVAAYIPGWPVPTDFFAQIPACNSPEQTGCVASWCTFKDGYEPPSLDLYYQNAIVTNPLNWRSDGTPATKEEHKGFLMENYKKIYTQSVNARQHQGILWLTSPFPVVSLKNYHVADFNLFWVDVRDNAQLRVNTYVEHGGSSQK